MSKEIPSTSRKNGKYIYRYACLFIITALATIMFMYSWFSFVKINNRTGSLTGLGNLGMAFGIYFVVFSIIGKWLHAFRIGVERKASILAGQMLTFLTVDFFETFISCAITGQFRLYFSFVKQYIPLFLVQTIVICLLTIPMIDIYRKRFPPLQIIEIYGNYNNDLVEKVNGVYQKYHIADGISAFEDEKIIQEKIEPFDAVLLNDLPAHTKNRIIKMCFEMNKRVYYVPKISDILVKNSEELNLIDAPLFVNRNNGMGPIQRFAKRFFDISFSLIAIVLLSPIMLITAIAIYIEDKGPVFYKQERVTIGNRRFNILKFRSMIVDAEKDGKPRPAGANDDRITKVGKYIRPIRVDELPQLINILVGDMSIVGPRPERWEHVEQYSKDIPEFSYRTKVKGGLTGYAQVYGKYNTNALDKLKLDLTYITNYSFLLDLQIIFETIKILFIKDSTEGFSENTRSKIHDADINSEEE